MIRDVIRQSWRQSPTRTLLAVPAAVLTVFLGWLWLVVVLEAASPMG